MKTAFLILAAFLISLIAYFGVALAGTNLDWVKGKYGTKCYPEGQEHGNLRYKVYYSSYEECIASISE